MNNNLVRKKSLKNKFGLVSSILKNKNILIIDDSIVRGNTLKSIIDMLKKSGVNKNDVHKLSSYCKEIGLNLIGLMCIPPINVDPDKYFEEMKQLNKSLGFSELSMGMSSDFLLAAKHLSTFVRIGSNIFGKRS